MMSWDFRKDFCMKGFYRNKVLALQGLYILALQRGKSNSPLFPGPVGYMHHFSFQDIHHLRRLACLRICIYDEDEYVDLTDRNFRKFVKMALQGHPRMKLKILDGASPAVTKPHSQPNRQSECPAKKELSWETDFKFMSPAELDIKEKESELNEKIRAVESLNSRYLELSSDMNTNVWRDKSKRICHNCHGRTGHDKKKCKDVKCTDVRICGEIDLHPDSKKELSVLSIKKQKLEGEINALTSELDAKRKANQETHNTFEGKIFSWLIRSNPEKYLIKTAGQVRQVRVNADTAILRKVFEGQVSDDLETSSQFWKDIIDTSDIKYRQSTEKPSFTVSNPVRKELENKGVVWPTHVPTIGSPAGHQPQPPFPYFPQMPYGAPGQAIRMPYYGFVTPPVYSPPSATVTSGELETGQPFPPLPTEPPPSPPDTEEKLNDYQ